MQESKHILAYLKSMRNSLTKSEKKIADLILTQPEKIVYMTISEISSLSQVGDTTVLRLCRKLGFPSFQNFKYALVQDITNREADGGDAGLQIKKEDSLEEISKKVIDYNTGILEETSSLIDHKELAAACDAIINARKIAIFAVGASLITGLDLHLKLMRIGYQISCHLDLHTQMMAASLLSESDLAIGISFSGSSKDTIKNLILAKDAGASILCITHHINSPITDIADITLLHGAKEDPLEGGSFSSKIAQISILDILYHAVYIKSGADISRNKNKTSKAITDSMI